MKSLKLYLREDYKRNFIEAAKILLEHEPFISINDLLAKHKVIKPIRGPRPTPKEIEDAGYRHDGIGNIIGKHGRILKGCTSRNHDNYKRHNLRIKGFGRKDADRGNRGEWTPQAHILIFALVHRRWPRDGMVIDHIDGNPRNNHPDNLREVTHRENNLWVKKESNTTKPIKTNSIGTQLIRFFK